MLALGRANAAQAGARNARFLHGHIEDIPLPADHVDVVISNCVIKLYGDDGCPTELEDQGSGSAFRNPAQFALDANQAPGPVLPRQVHDQGGQFVADRRTARRLRLPPPRGDQPAVPAQQRSRRDNPVGA
jgi:hypothetical protein